MDGKHHLRIFQVKSARWGRLLETTTVLFPRLLRDQQGIHLLLVPLLVGLAFAVFALVYSTGGIKYVYSHSMYFPILLAGYLYGVPGGALMGLLGSILLGPFMPIDTATHEAQETLNWIYRGIFFVSVGMLVGYGTTLLRKQMDQIRALAHSDKHTGLPNRTSTLEYLSRILRERPKEAGEQYVLMKVSCDNLMEIEVAFGFAASDSIVRQMQRRLVKALPVDAFLSKTHRSKFAVILSGMSPAATELLVRDLSEMLKHAFSYRKVPLHVEAAIGYVAFSDGEEDADRLLQMAELALMHARKTHQKAIAYDPVSHSVSRENLALLGELREAVTGGQLQLHYQPKVSLTDHTVIGAEALMRWHHPKHGMIPPDQFIPQAEQSNLIGELTEWALHSALAQQALWKTQEMHDRLKVAVNVSVHDLLAPAFSDTVLQALDHHSVDSRDLELEVTENVLMENIETSIAVLNRLADANVVISIDDFGTGYSSLKYLDQLPTAAIKIDQSFVFRLASDKRSRHIVQAAIELAHALEMKVIAEGVETLEVFHMLRDMGCDIAQGYFISRPLKAEEFAGFSFQVA